LSPESLWIHPAALEEAEAATDWYAQRSNRAAERFLDELDSAVDHILRNPGRYPAYEHGTRRMVLRRFPFVIVFREAIARLEIIAIAHGRRSPSYWRDRVG
jgi:plasmid stabilization system protein ParE